MSKLVTTFPNATELDLARTALEGLGLAHEIVSAAPAYARVGTAALVIDEDERMQLADSGKENFITSGWVEHREHKCAVPPGAPSEFEEDVFGTCAVMVLAPCVADKKMLRITAHLSGDLAPVFPYMNGDTQGVSFNPDANTFTFMDKYRMIAVYPHRITIAKADDMVDAWRVLEEIRTGANDVWRRRADIEPSYEMRQRPPAIEIFKRLPGTNCGQCGERACLAFAAKLWKGETSPKLCRPVFGGDRAELREALLDICAGLGISAADDEGGDA